MGHFDTNLIGIWIVPGSFVTYEVLPDGSFHVADPETALAYEGGGTAMLWDPMRLVRLEGAGETPIGRWREDRAGDIWAFMPDGTYTVEVEGDVYHGIWALRSGGAALWTREMRAGITTNGTDLTFAAVHGPTATYRYTVADGIWSLFDPQTGAVAVRYVRPETVTPAEAKLSATVLAPV